MCQDNNTTVGKGFKQFTYNDRVKLETMLKMNRKNRIKKDRMTQKDMSRELRKTTRTLRREIKKGMMTRRNPDWTEEKVYDAYKANEYAKSRKGFSGREIKLEKDYEFEKYLKEKIVECKMSPEAVLLEMKNKGIEFNTKVCVKTIYNYINDNVFEEITNDNLVVKSNKRKKKGKPRAKTPKRAEGPSIEERPDIINDKKEIGHYEMDTVVGKRKGKGPVLLVLTERVTNHEIILKLPGKKAEDVIKGLRKIKKEYKNQIKSLTVDNGSEFLKYKEMRKVFKGKVEIYYCHPYCSYERAMNECANKLIRRWIKKGTDMYKYTNKQIRDIQNWMNDYPRRKYKGNTANMMYNEYVTKLATI